MVESINKNEVNMLQKLVSGKIKKYENDMFFLINLPSGRKLKIEELSVTKQKKYRAFENKLLKYNILNKKLINELKK